MTDAPAKAGERGMMELLRSDKAIVARRQVHADLARDNGYRKAVVTNTREKTDEQ